MTARSTKAIDWDEIRRRMARSEVALNDSLTLSGEELTKLFDERAARLGKRQTEGPAAAGALSVLVFKVGKERYGLEIAELAEVLSYRGCTPVPGTSTALLGLINVRGEIWPVFDIARLLEVEHENVSDGYVLMVRAAGSLIGFRVDQVEQVRNLSHSDVSLTKQGQGESASRHVKGLTEDTLMLINVGSLTQRTAPSET